MHDISSQAIVKFEVDICQDLRSTVGPSGGTNNVRTHQQKDDQRADPPGWHRSALSNRCEFREGSHEESGPTGVRQLCIERAHPGHDACGQQFLSNQLESPVFLLGCISRFVLLICKPFATCCSTRLAITSRMISEESQKLLEHQQTANVDAVVRNCHGPLEKNLCLFHSSDPSL